MIPLLSKYGLVYLIGILELWGAVPAGLAFKLNPVYVAIVSAAGAMTGAILVLIIGEPLRRWLLRLKKTNLEKENGKLKHIWEKHGIPGLCIISPVFLGAHLGAAIGIAFGGNRAVIALWMTLSCVLWSSIFTTLGTMGISMFHK
jgi:membrane protein DedA with SNARE-associated domain